MILLILQKNITDFHDLFDSQIEFYNFDGFSYGIQ